MDFRVTENEEEAIHTAEEVTQLFGPDYWLSKYENREFPLEFWREITQRRLTGYITPRDAGGLGNSFLKFCLLVEKLAEGGAGFGLYSLISSNLTSVILQEHGGEEVRGVAEEIINYGVLVGLAITEEDSGSDVFAIKTTARKVEGGFILNGEKTFVNNIKHSTYYMVLAKTSSKQTGGRNRELTLFLLNTKREGVSFRELDKMGMDYTSLGVMRLDNVFVEDNMVIGDLGNGWKILTKALNADRIAYAALAVGVGKMALNIATEYAKDRVVFNRPIGSNQGVQFPLAEAWILLESAWTHVLKAAWLYDAGERTDVDACMVKYAATYAMFKSLKAAMTALGGHGYLRKFHVERLIRDGWILASGPISQELALAYVASRGLGLPRSF
ncbi:MAG TPA: acyl-CoA dehydrogenase [Candidatus Caldiarchaeum subterraneum]|uniref:Acyl-CoA dehydrogenase n=1 Tax=Caldiarchaeum subterraneum TaxID=311458 RepID=A0A833EBM0_CALS0|nr:acyl-CoA dehydrogenase [Candidatus Caldarchaeum subterraneum]